MNILLTNDDGFNSEGILLLKEKLSKYGRVVIVAPLFPMSAKSVSITIGQGLILNKEEEDIYSFSGTPADCVAFALSSLDIDFDLVVSGCNNGLNVSYDTMYSGTIGAGLEAYVFHKKAIAFSCPVNQFNVVNKYFDKVFKYIIENELINDEYLLNVNFPYDDVKNIEMGELYYRNDFYYFTKKEDGYYAYRRLQEDFSDNKNSDEYQIRHNIVSIVPLHKTYFFKENKTK